MSYEQQREQQNYGNTLRNEAQYVAGLENSGNYMAARNRLAEDALSMGANSTVAGATAFRQMTQEIRQRETGSVHIREYNTSQRGDQVFVALDRPNGQPGGAVLVDNLATGDRYAAPQTQARGYDPSYPTERYPAAQPAAYPPPDVQAYPPRNYSPQAYPPTGYDQTAAQYPPAPPVYDAPLPNQLNYPYATPPFVGPQPIIQANFGFGGGEPWRMREMQHEMWAREHRHMRPYYGGNGGYEGYYATPAYVPNYYSQFQPAPAYYAPPNPAGSMIAGGIGGAVIGALAGGRRGAAIGGIAGFGLGAILGG